MSIPDPGLNAAVRETLSKPAGPLTLRDLLTLTNLNASFRDVKSLEGLGAAHNLIRLFLGRNQLANVVFPEGLTNLKTLYLDQNQMTDLALPSDLTNLASLELGNNQLTNLSVRADLPSLSNLHLDNNPLINFAFLSPNAEFELVQHPRHNSNHQPHLACRSDEFDQI